MGRSERSLDAGDDPLTRFAADLRRARDAAGKPTYRAMSRKAHRSPTTLSEAAGGRAVPSWPTVEAFLLACGVTDHAEWRRRWDELRDEPDPVPDQPPPDPPPPDQPPAGRRRLIGVAIGAVLVVAAAALVLTKAVSGTDDAPPPPTAATRQVADGADPEDTGCANDPGAVTLDAREVNLDGVPVGVVELRYAPVCGVSWPRFTPGDPRYSTITKPGPIEARLTVGPDDEPAREQAFTTRYTGLPVFGNVVNSTRQCVRARVGLTGPGWSTTDGVTACYRGMTAVAPPAT
ncbi:helix-turn-helix domain-containing protein [Actinosynnema sp. NPDC053489]|uniref:helix-turn-helix domain-containing protein n=1 Tax=Actinosynnema sp. NPDC053489 TaxID=3363916 RepID=UPI0037C75838